MPRPIRPRRVGFVPQFARLVPEGGPASESVPDIVLTVDEAEAIRLSDLEGLDQEDAAVAMDVARTTFQRIIHQARYKTAQCLILGIPLRIEGGKYAIHLCPECAEENDDCLDCQRRRHHKGALGGKRFRGRGARQ